VAPMRVVTASDLPAFRQMVVLLAVVEECRATINAMGLTFTVSTESGEVIRKRPEVEILLTGQKNLSAMLSHFGLTPAMRQKVTVLGEEKEGDPMDEFVPK
jgi:P27 family predicted phage terminase small subunit